MSATALAVCLVGLLLLGALLGRAGLVALYRWKRIYYSPSDAPRLTPAGVRFLRDLVEAGGGGEILGLSPGLGWAHRPGARSRDGLVEIGPHGERAGPPASDPVSLEIATYGDCLVMGAATPADQTWQAHLQRAAAGVRVWNFGVEGFGLGQSWLCYEETRSRIGEPAVAVLGVASSNVMKVQNAFRPFYAYDHGLQLGKPSFAIGADGLEVVPNPLPDVAAYEALLADPGPTLARLARLDHYQRNGYRRHVADGLTAVRLLRVIRSETRKAFEVRDLRGRLRAGAAAVRVSLAVLDAFATGARSRGTHPVVLLLPVPSEVARFRRSGARPWDVVRDALAACGVECLDLFDVVAALPEPHFTGRHYAAPVQRAIGAALAQRLPAWRTLHAERGGTDSRSAASSAR